MKKKSNFTIDKVSEDSFYGNLLLGLPKFLDKCRFITDTLLYRYPPATCIDILSWEHENCVLLTDEIRNFYASCNGFSYTYVFCQESDKSKSNCNLENSLVGSIQINPLQKLTRVYGYETRNTEKIEKINNKYHLSLSPRSKLFELSAIDANAKVVLVYINPETDPSIWLLSNKISFFYLARDLVTYLRMCLAHLGAPGWQYTISPTDSIPDFTRVMLNIIAPGILYECKNIPTKQREETTSVMNVIDPGVFNLSYVSVVQHATSATTSTNTRGSKSRKASRQATKR